MNNCETYFGWLPRWKCHKIVRAVQIESITKPDDKYTIKPVIDDRNKHMGLIIVDSEFIEKHNPQVGGYFVIYDDNYQSFSPKEAFEAGYSPYSPCESKPIELTERDRLETEIKDLKDKILKIESLSNDPYIPEYPRYLLHIQENVMFAYRSVLMARLDMFESDSETPEPNNDSKSEANNAKADSEDVLPKIEPNMIKSQQVKGEKDLDKICLRESTALRSE